MHPAAFDRDEPAGRWVLPFDPADADPRQHRQRGEHRHGNRDTISGEAYRTKDHGNTDAQSMQSVISPSADAGKPRRPQRRRAVKNRLPH
jgi:hypothetical protein